MAPKARPAEERFWEKVNRTEGCWLWTGGTSFKGYGRLKVSRGRTVYAHRFAYELMLGPVQGDLDHCYTCPKNCVNPAHLRPLPNKQNQENRAGPNSNGTSGARGVYWQAARGKWVVGVQHNGRQHHGGMFVVKEEAVAAAIALRNRLFTYNDADREPRNGDTGPEHEVEVVPETKPWKAPPVAPPVPSTPAPAKEPVKEPAPV